MKEDKKLTLVEHLGELRGRVIKSVIFIIVCSLIAYKYVDSILLVLIRPVGNLVFLAPQEAFVAHIRIALWGGLFLSSPFVLYQVWEFVSRGLKPNERKHTLIFGPLSLLFFILGAAFGYFIIVPVGIRFLLGFATDMITPMLAMSRYISFVGTLVLTFGVVFQLPLISLFLTKIGMITPRFLSSRRKPAIVLMFILAAIFTPPDIITQLLMAVPLIILYEIGIIFSKSVYRRPI